MTPYSLDGAGTCIAGTLGPAEFYFPGERIDLSTLPGLETLLVGTGKVRALFSGFGGVPYLPIQHLGSPLVDESGSACTHFGSPDGTLRCVATSTVVSARSAFRYEDASCTAPVVPWVTGCPEGARVPPVVALLDETVGCRDGLAFSETFAVAGEGTASTHYTKDVTTGACALAGPVSTGVKYLRLGETLGPTVFPEIGRALRE